MKVDDILAIGHRRDGRPIWPIAGGTNTFGITARAYGWFNDGTESGMTAIAAENTAIQFNKGAGDLSIVLRYGVQESGSGSASGVSTDDYQLQFSTNGGGAWNAVSGASSGVQSWASANLTDAGAASTQKLSSGTGSFINGEISEDGLLDDWQLTANNYSELVYTVKFVASGLTVGQTVTFRVLRNGAIFNTYSQTPTVTVTSVIQQAVTTATETEASSPDANMGRLKTRAVGTITETQEAVAITRNRAKAITTATETEDPQGITRLKTLAVATITETQEAIVLTRVKTLVIGTATETNESFEITASFSGGGQSVAVDPALETDEAIALTAAKTLAVGIATESNAAQDVGRLKSLVLPTASATETAPPLTAAKAMAVTTASETDTAQALTSKKALAVSTSTETEAAIPLTRLKSRTLLGYASTAITRNSPESAADGYIDFNGYFFTYSVVTNSQNGSLHNEYSVGDDAFYAAHGYYAFDTSAIPDGASIDSATIAFFLTLNQLTGGARLEVYAKQWRPTLASDDFELSPSGLLVAHFTPPASPNGVYTFDDDALASIINKTGETEVVLIVQNRTAATNSISTDFFDHTTPSVRPLLSVTYSTGLENDAAQTIGRVKTKTIGIATETSTAGTASAPGRVAKAEETDTAEPITALKSLGVATVSESDSAQAITAAKTVAIGIATETNAAQAITHTKTKAIAFASETDTASSFSTTTYIAVGIATETNTALAITYSRAYAVGIAQETNAAQAVAKSKVKVFTLAAEVDVAIAITRKGIKKQGSVTLADSTAGSVTLDDVLVGSASLWDVSLGDIIVQDS